MPTDRPDPGEFFEMAQRMLRSLFTDPYDDSRDDDDRPSGGDPWAEATRRVRESFARERQDSPPRGREPSAQRQRENLTFALATRAVEALEDLALNVAAIRQRLERTGTQGKDVRPEPGDRGPEGDSATGEQPPPDAT